MVLGQALGEPKEWSIDVEKCSLQAYNLEGFFPEKTGRNIVIILYAVMAGVVSGVNSIIKVSNSWNE